MLVLSLQSLNEHLPRSLAGDLDEIAQEFFRGSVVLGMLLNGAPFPPALARWHFRLTSRRVCTLRSSRILQSTTFEHISMATTCALIRLPTQGSFEYPNYSPNRQGVLPRSALFDLEVPTL